ncbi:37229_t:CDS:2, partial [Gigaspora margarita]
DQLVALVKGHIPENTIKSTEKWIKVMNQWQSNVNYSEPLQSGFYSRVSLKNALSAISHYLQYVKPNMKKKGLGESKSTDGLTTENIQYILNYEVLDPNTLLELLKQGFFGFSYIVQLEKGLTKNDQGEIDRNQFDLIIPFLSDSQGVKGPNSNIR